jgi:hypothetical protein
VSILFLIIYSLHFLMLLPQIWNLKPITDFKSLFVIHQLRFLIEAIALLYCLLRSIISFATFRLGVKSSTGQDDRPAELRHKQVEWTKHGRHERH